MTTLAQLYDADRHATGRNDIARDAVLVPHPLTGVRYADGVAPGPEVARRRMEWAR